MPLLGFGFGALKAFVVVVLGGMGSLLGVAIAAVIMIGGTEIMRELDFLKAVFGSNFDPTQYRMLLFGFAMVLIMVWRPRGLIAYDTDLNATRRQAGKPPVYRIVRARTVLYAAIIAVAIGVSFVAIGSSSTGWSSMFRCRSFASSVRAPSASIVG